MTTDEKLDISWNARAKRLLELAIGKEGDDAIITVSAALACLRIDAGELPEDELDGYPFPEEPDQNCICICPPELLARGGFKGRCPAQHFYEEETS